MTIVQLMWLEILQQTELGHDLMMPGQESKCLEKHATSIARILRLASAKIKASDFLIRLHTYRQKMMAASAAAEPRPERTPAIDSQSLG